MPQFFFSRRISQTIFRLGKWKCFRPFNHLFQNIIYFLYLTYDLFGIMMMSIGAKIFSMLVKSELLFWEWRMNKQWIFGSAYNCSTRPFCQKRWIIVGSIESRLRRDWGRWEGGEGIIKWCEISIMINFVEHLRLTYLFSVASRKQLSPKSISASPFGKISVWNQSTDFSFAHLQLFETVFNIHFVKLCLFLSLKTTITFQTKLLFALFSFPQ